MHAGVISRNIQRDRAFSLNKQGPPPHPFVPRSASGRPGVKPPTSRGCVKRSKVKGKKGKKGARETYDLIVNIDLTEHQLSDEQVAEFKEVFMLFDKDEDGVLTFPELNVVMKSLGQRPSENELLTMVRDVSEDHIYDTIEFNEFLQMMSKQQKYRMNEQSLRDAFRIFDKDDDGLLSVDELRHIMKNLGEKMKDAELDEMIAEADSDNDGLINYEEFVLVLCNEGKGKGVKKKKNHRGKDSSSTEMATLLTLKTPNKQDPKKSVDAKPLKAQSTPPEFPKLSSQPRHPAVACPATSTQTIGQTQNVAKPIENGNIVSLTK